MNATLNAAFEKCTCMTSRPLQNEFMDQGDVRDRNATDSIRHRLSEPCGTVQGWNQGWNYRSTATCLLVGSSHQMGIKEAFKPPTNDPASNKMIEQATNNKTRARPAGFTEPLDYRL